MSKWLYSTTLFLFLLGSLRVSSFADWDCIQPLVKIAQVGVPVHTDGVNLDPSSVYDTEFSLRVFGKGKFECCFWGASRVGFSWAPQHGGSSSHRVPWSHLSCPQARGMLAIALWVPSGGFLSAGSVMYSFLKRIYFIKHFCFIAESRGSVCFTDKGP